MKRRITLMGIMVHTMITTTMMGITIIIIITTSTML